MVQMAGSLPGMCGALIAFQDGLLVAGHLPSTLNGEMIAAFLPQMFGRMRHYTNELKLGEPTSISVDLNGQSMEITKTGNVYFMALGRVGEALPEPQLKAIAMLLKQQSQPA